MLKYIYYTGIGSKKNGKHTINEFLKIMNTKFNIKCSQYLTELEYKTCIEKEKMNKDYIKKYRKNNSYKRDNKASKKFNRLCNKCNKHKQTLKNRKCSLEEYKKFSGADK